MSLIKSGRPKPPRGVRIIAFRLLEGEELQLELQLVDTRDGHETIILVEREKGEDDIDIIDASPANTGTDLAKDPQVVFMAAAPAMRNMGMVGSFATETPKYMKGEVWRKTIRLRVRLVRKPLQKHGAIIYLRLTFIDEESGHRECYFLEDDQEGGMS